MVASEWGVGQVVWVMLWAALFFVFVWLAITVIVDIFRSHDLGGFAKVVWLVFVIFLPFIGVFSYLIARKGLLGPDLPRPT